MDKEKAQPFGQRFLKMLDEAVSREEVVELSKELVETMKKVSAALDEKTTKHSDDMTSRHEQHMAQMQEATNQLMQAVAENKEITKSEARTITRMLQYEVKRLEDLIEDVRSEIPDLAHVQADYTARIDDVGRRIPVLPQQRDYSEEITSSKEELKAEIEALRTELRNRPIARGGGTSAMGVAQAFKYIAHTEQPSGLINGSNTVYTVKNTIFWIAGFTLNGEQIAELPNFTYSGKTITFSSALPAAYSGKDFEVKYIGH